jgi:multisubunit Na+/H+ antiporter MnhB subunit
MHQLTCPHCGQKMKTKKLVVGTVLCPKCNQKFRTMAPTPPTPEPQRTPKEKEEHIRMLIMAPIGAIFLLIALFVIADDPDDLESWMNPFFLAPAFCGLFFLTPTMFAFLRYRDGRVNVDSHTHQTQQNASMPSQPVDRTAENVVMSIFGSMAVIMGVIALLFLIVVLYFFFIILGWISENGLPFPSGF